jgi:putative membrane protein
MRMTAGKWCLAALMSAGLATGMAHAQATDADKQFLMTASESDLTEIKLSQLAMQKSSSTKVKDFAGKMISDHTTLEEKMKPYADKWGVTPATSLNADHQAEYDKLNGLSGDEFDKEFFNAMAMSHHMALDAFKSELASTQDMKFKKTVSAGEKVVAQHTAMADKMNGKMS